MPDALKGSSVMPEKTQEPMSDNERLRAISVLLDKDPAEEFASNMMYFINLLQSLKDILSAPPSEAEGELVEVKEEG